MPNKQVVEHREFLIGPNDLPLMPNAPFPLQTPDGDPLPMGLVTRDLVHAFYDNLNMHAGYSDVDSGDRHIARIIDSLQKSSQWDRMLVVVTFDENGGWWDHVAPPAGDWWGPGTRIPAIIISPIARRGEVDHTIYDTGSIARFITRRWGLETLEGLTTRERTMIVAGGPPPGDLTNALRLS